MNKINDGGSAFPFANPYGPASRGMSLREYFAGEMMARTGLGSGDQAGFPEEAAGVAVRAADALIAELAKGEQP